MLKINSGKQPTKRSPYSAGIDLYANEDVTIGAGQTVTVPLGVYIDFENFWSDYAGANLSEKSKTQLDSFKKHFLKRHYLELHLIDPLIEKGLISAIRIIDIDFKAEIKITIHNLTSASYFIKKGDKIAQILLKEHRSFLFVYGLDLD